MKKIKELLNENVSVRENCNLCNEISLKVGDKTNYGSIIVYKNGSSLENSWFATLSPKTGGDPEKDFTLQLMPSLHFSQLSAYPESAKNYGIAFAEISKAIIEVMADKDFKSIADTREEGISVATYGKCTNWKEKKEHLHLKIFPFKRNIGQPYTVDSTFEKKEIHIDPLTKEEFVKMMPVHKVLIPTKRLEQLAQQLIEILNQIE